MALTISSAMVSSCASLLVSNRVVCGACGNNASGPFHFPDGIDRSSSFRFLPFFTPVKEVRLNDCCNYFRLSPSLKCNLLNTRPDNMVKIPTIRKVYLNALCMSS